MLGTRAEKIIRDILYSKRSQSSRGDKCEKLTIQMDEFDDTNIHPGTPDCRLICLKCYVIAC